MTQPSGSEIATPSAAEVPTFSLLLGGPLFQFYRRMHLTGNGLELVRRRVVAITLFVWLPLLILSALEGHALGGAVAVPFLHDIEMNVRFLVALPVLIVAEVLVNVELALPVRQFMERRIVAPEDMPRFRAAVTSALRARNSVVLELSLLVLVYTVGLWFWRSQIALGASTWYAWPEATHLRLRAAGYWYAYVSIPIFQFILLRWYMHLVLWFRLLWHVSRLNLRLSVAHPDRAGGIGFLAKTSYAFGPILFAQGALLAGVLASRILFEGQTLKSLMPEAAGFVGFYVVFILGPLLMFSPMLARVRRQGAADYGLLAYRYVSGFEDKWIRGGVPEASRLLGSVDLQALGDLGNSYSVVQQMRTLVFQPRDIVRLAITTAAPLLPLALTMFSLEDLVIRVIKIIM